jgi:translation initiation factor 2B subunit (eIF-2B alpha/beta/delta family)
MINPKTGKAWSLGTINRDCQIMRDKWQEEASRNFAEHMEDQLNRIKLAQTRAWSEGDLDAYARFMEQEIKITGTGQAEMRNTHEEQVSGAWDVFSALDSIASRIEERSRLAASQTIDGEIVDP